MQQIEYSKRDIQRYPPGSEDLAAIERLHGRMVAAKSALDEQKPSIDEIVDTITSRQNATIWMRYFAGTAAENERVLRERIRWLITTITPVLLLYVSMNNSQLSSLNHVWRKVEVDVGQMATDDWINRMADKLQISELSKVLNEVHSELKSASSLRTQQLPYIHPEQIMKSLGWRRDQLLKTKNVLQIREKQIEFSNGRTSTRPAAVMVGVENSKETFRAQGYIEWKTWDDDGKVAGDKDFVRTQIGMLSKVLGTKGSPETARIPLCRGYFEDSAHRRFGLFFSIERLHICREDSQRVVPPEEPASLHRLISVPECAEPSRERKTQWAINLANALFSLHSLRVCHKATSGKNVLLFPNAPASSSGSSTNMANFDELYLAGFSDARIDEAYSEHIPQAPIDRMYLPLDYHKRRRGFSTTSNVIFYYPRYDLFGLGLTLLELAHWKSMPEFWKEWDCEDEFALNRAYWYKVEELVEQSERTMGRPFRDLVHWSLKSGQVVTNDPYEHLAPFNAKIKLLEEPE